MVATVFQVIHEIRRQGVTVLMVEQNAALALQMADRAYVMESGCIALEGAARDLLHNADVRRAYLGG
jgi:branched-chain amino acid transport system ATP-binding protein